MYLRRHHTDDLVKFAVSFSTRNRVITGGHIEYMHNTFLKIKFMAVTSVYDGVDSLVDHGTSILILYITWSLIH